MNLEITTQQGLSNLEYQVQIEMFTKLQELNNFEDLTEDEIQYAKDNLTVMFINNLRFVAKASIDNNLNCVTINDKEIEDLLEINEKELNNVITTN